MAEKRREYKFLVERMHFSNPYIFMAYFVLGLILVILQDWKYPNLDPEYQYLIMYGSLVLPGAFYIAFALKDVLAKIDLHLGVESPLRDLFDSKDEFLKFRDALLERISSVEKIYSFLCSTITVGLLIIYDVVTDSFGKPWAADAVSRGGLLIYAVNHYVWWWIVGFAGFGVAWGIYYIIATIKEIEQKEKDLKITKSIKTLNTLTNGEENDENIIKNNSLKSYYSYTKLLVDYEKIIEITSSIATRIAIIAIIFSMAYLVFDLVLLKIDLDVARVGLTIGIAIFAIFVFITPQFSAHKLLKRTKKEIYTTISDVYEQHKLRLLNKYASFSPVKSSMVNGTEFLKKIVDETADLRTWPVEIDAVPPLAVATATVASLAPLIVQLIS